MSSKLFKFALVLLFLLGTYTRFLKLDWGDSFYFHPDENNMASAITQFSSTNLNPNFYAYGQFPLYLAYFPVVLVNHITGHSNPFAVSYPQAVMSLRIFSAIFSLIAILYAIGISHRLFSNKLPQLAFLSFFVFSPGLIQLAHFGTTESLLILVFLANIHYAFRFTESPKFKYLLLAAFFSAIGISSKLTAVIFILPIALALLFNFVSRLSWRPVLYGFAFLIITLIGAAALSPYNLIKPADFVSSMRYETDVATGASKVFYTNQFLSTIPYLFQLIKIFPYSSGLIVFIFAIIGILAFVVGLLKPTKINGADIFKWSLIVIPALVYFLYFGQLYTKWFRFMSPIFFILPLFAAHFLSRINNKYVLAALTIAGILPGLMFMRLYLDSDIRVQFSRWFEQNIPADATVLSEAGNVMNIPLTTKSYNVTNFDFYNLDQNQTLASQLPQEVYKADYILIPSRRMFKNQANAQFPYSQNYYYHLFLGQLGFTPLKSFSINNTYLLNSEDAEETYSVFDQPTIRLYVKTNHLSLSELNNLLVTQAN